MTTLLSDAQPSSALLNAEQAIFVHHVSLPEEQTPTPFKTPFYGGLRYTAAWWEAQRRATGG